MVAISLKYEGELRCVSTHEPSVSQIRTDAPRDNAGKGEAFSPTDLVATALGTCMVTTMAIVARRKGSELPPVTAALEKHMSTDSPRRIAKIVVRLTIPLPPAHPDRELLEAAARQCPVHHTLHPEVEREVHFQWVG